MLYLIKKLFFPLKLELVKLPLTEIVDYSFLFDTSQVYILTRILNENDDKEGIEIRYTENIEDIK